MLPIPCLLKNINILNLSVIHSFSINYVISAEKHSNHYPDQSRQSRSKSNNEEGPITQLLLHNAYEIQI